MGLFKMKLKQKCQLKVIAKSLFYAFHAIAKRQKSFPNFCKAAGDTGNRKSSANFMTREMKAKESLLKYGILFCCIGVNDGCFLRYSLKLLLCRDNQYQMWLGKSVISAIYARLPIFVISILKKGCEVFGRETFIFV